MRRESSATGAVLVPNLHNSVELGSEDILWTQDFLCDSNALTTGSRLYGVGFRDIDVKVKRRLDEQSNIVLFLQVVSPGAAIAQVVVRCFLRALIRRPR